MAVLAMDVSGLIYIFVAVTGSLVKAVDSTWLFYGPFSFYYFRKDNIKILKSYCKFEADFFSQRLSVKTHSTLDSFNN